MTWNVEFLKEAAEDLNKLDGSIKKQVVKGIAKVSQNPLPDYKGGYGKPLGKRDSSDLTGLMKIKFVKIGIRVVYKPIVTGNVMKIIVISARGDNQVYDEAYIRRRKNEL